MMVPPGTAARAAVRTFWAVVPVSRVSPESDWVPEEVVAVTLDELEELGLLD